MNKYKVTYIELSIRGIETVEAYGFEYFHNCGKLGVVFKDGGSPPNNTSIFFDVVKVTLVK